ncbi:type II toxin-antitoxin system VapC family toxin [Nigerium massiliense]|uniref:type II toxin-antitoxin system VapC family toxin n=1 Tax=Nigerium massiliense TaxID=1522317 RepID=UPI00058ABE0D|nr:type II toxin-antitoxin system VapC family toxin [Nigerium massiliense]
MVEALVGAAPASELLDAVEGDLHAPHLLDVEVTSVLRGLELGRVLHPDRVREALDDYWSFSIERYDLEPLRARVWALRHQFTSYDASSIALAEALGAPLVTCDRKLAAPGHRAEVLVMHRAP